MSHVLSKPTPTVMLADDHPHVAQQIALLLQEQFKVVAVVPHGEALLAEAARLMPDVVVTDISMPGLDGIEAAQILRSRLPSLAVVFITVHDEAALARRALAVGHGYVLKASAGEDLIDAIHAALEGDLYISDALAGLLVSQS